MLTLLYKPSINFRNSVKTSCNFPKIISHFIKFRSRFCFPSKIHNEVTARMFQFPYKCKLDDRTLYSALGIYYHICIRGCTVVQFVHYSQ